MKAKPVEVHSRFSYTPIKYMIEYLLALALAVTLAPLMLLISIIIAAHRDGPILYRSERIGLHGKPFRLYKFRTMSVGCPEILNEFGEVLSLRNDPRATKFGNFLRIGLDELPQLYNVLRGEMTLVGPRPDIARDVMSYTNRQKNRLKVKPGVTGLAAVCGGREKSNEWNYEADLIYIAILSPCLDCYVIWRTILYVIGANEKTLPILGRIKHRCNQP